MDVEAAGGATTAGLMSAALERPTGRAGETHKSCSDCGADVIGRFCHACGQPAHVPRTLSHLVEEILHGVMHFDGRLWRTLPLLVFRPGRLTREWVQGRRTRYVSPLAMFLFTVFVMFLALGFTSFEPSEALRTEVRVNGVELAQARARLAEAQAAAADEGAANPQAAAAVTRARREVAAAQDDAGDLQALQSTGVADWKATLAERARIGELNINTGDQNLDKKIVKKFENPDLALYKLQQTFYKFSFLLVPLSIPFVALLFLWRRGFTLYDHGVFVLYSLTFMSFLIMAGLAAIRMGGGWAAAALGAIPFVVPAHMFFQLKGAYGLRAVSALWRTLMLLIFCAIVLGVFLLSVVWLGLI